MTALEVGSSAAELAVLLEGEREVPLAELGGGRPLVLVFLRHFG